VSFGMQAKCRCGVCEREKERDREREIESLLAFKQGVDAVCVCVGVSFGIQAESRFGVG